MRVLLREQPGTDDVWRDTRLVSYSVLRGISTLGDNVWAIALGFAAASIGDPRLVGLVFAASALPRLLLMLLGGVIADRFPPRAVMIVCDLAACALFLGMLGLSRGGDVAPIVLIGAAALFGVVDAFYEPAVGAFIPQLVDTERRAAAEGLMQTVGTIATFAGLAAGGALFAWGGLSLTAAVNAASFALLALGISWVAPRYPREKGLEQGAVWDQARLGISAVFGSRPVRDVLILVVLLNGLALPSIQVSLPLRAASEGWGAFGYAVAEAAFALGGIAGGIYTLRSSELRAGRGSPVNYAVAAAAGLIVVGFADEIWLACVAVFVVAVSLVPCNALAMAKVQAATDSQVIGRVMSVILLAGAVAGPLGLSAFGLLAAASSVTLTGVAYASTLLVLLLIASGSSRRRTHAGGGRSGGES